MSLALLCMWALQPANKTRSGIYGLSHGTRSCCPPRPPILDIVVTSMCGHVTKDEDYEAMKGAENKYDSHRQSLSRRGAIVGGGVDMCVESLLNTHKSWPGEGRKWNERGCS